ncbi:hypothetical protein ACFYTQ_14475 [Nocardia sp. NPDC004068]|uniref:hypothetical protein n=1 Tax=Nocardia sp. NPDC004068 TaxID=3364303 RepID=UPI0036D0AC49
MPKTAETATRADIACAAAGLALVAAAVEVPRILGEQWSRRLYAGAAPLFGQWLGHIGWGTVPAVAIAVVVVARGPALTRRAPWRRLLVSGWLTAAAWAFALAMIDGWQRGFAGRLTTRDEYLHEVGGVTDIAATLRGFAGRILDFQPDSWTTHVSGHPPGALLTFVLLDRVGLGGGAWAAALCTLVGASASAAVAVAVRALGSEDSARAAMPFLVLAPAAIWVAVSADALFAGVTAWAVALLALAVRLGNRWLAEAFVSGVLFGFGIYLSYGLALMAVPAAGVLILGMLRARRAASIARPLFAVAVGALLVAGVFTAAGFRWFDGYHLVVQRYYQGIAAERPFSYWVWGNLAATACALGPAAVAAIHRVPRAFLLPLRRDSSKAERPAPQGDSSIPVVPEARPVPIRETPSGGAATVTRAPNVPARPFRRRLAAIDPAAVLAAAGLAAILAADLSGLSKAETERIWLPFDMWVLAATALLPARGARWWLAAQAVAALLINHLILTNW